MWAQSAWFPLFLARGMAEAAPAYGNMVPHRQVPSGEGACALRAIRLSRKRGAGAEACPAQEWSGAGAPKIGGK